MTTRVYVGNLPMDIRTREVEDIFYKYGRIRDIDVKFPSRPPAFAFVEFEDERDAEDAIRGRDGYEYDGARLRVEASNSGRRDRGGASRGGAFGRNVRGSGEYSVEVSGLPDRASWQDLKDFMRKAGDVVFSEVDGRGRGFVEYASKRDMNYAIEKLDDTEFRGRGDSAFVRVRASRGRSRSRSRGRSRSRSRSRSSRSRSRSRKRSRSRSGSAHSKSGDKDDEHKDKKKRSASRSKSGSPSRKEEDAKKPADEAKKDEDAPMDDASKPADEDKKLAEDASKPAEDTSKPTGEDAPMEDAKDKEAAAPDANGKTDASESDAKEPTATQDWASLTDEELREALKKRGLEADGEREELIKRLETPTAE